MQRDPRWENVFARVQNESFGPVEVLRFQLELVYKDTVYGVNYAADPQAMVYGHNDRFKLIMNDLVAEMDTHLPPIITE